MQIIVAISAILFSFYAQANCTIWTSEGPSERTTCVRSHGESDFSIEPEVLKMASYNMNGLGSLREGAKCYWFTRKGVTMQSPCTVSGADPFAAKFSRYINSDGKYGFMNWSLKTAISAKWSYTLPFLTTFAKVCEDCRVEIGPKGEVTKVSAGTWMIINLKGRVVKNCGVVNQESDCQL